MEQKAHPPRRDLIEALRHVQIVMRAVRSQILVRQERCAAVVGAGHMNEADAVLPFQVAVRQPFSVGQGETGHGHRPSLGKAPQTCNSRLPRRRARIIPWHMGDTTDPARLTAAREANAQGMAALRAGNAVLAAEAFRRATGLDPLAGALWRNLAHALRDCGDDQAELAVLDQALDLDRTDFVAQLRKAQNLQRTEQEEDALSAWIGALQLSLGIENPVPGLEAELQLGRDFVAEMQRRIGADADHAYAELEPVLDETERRRVRAFYDHSIGRRRVYANECAGLYYPFLPADEYFDFKHFPWLAELEAATNDIRAELHGLLEAGNPAIIPYVQMEPGAPQNKWSPLSHNYDWSACFLYEYGVPNQPVLDRCPKTAALLKRLPLQQIPGKAPNAFFSMLKPHSAIPPHTGVTNTRAIVHLALDVPQDCGFRVGGETRPWVEGKAFAFDDSIDHEAWNNSDERRHILIIDTWNPHLTPAEQQAIVRYFEATGRSLARP